MEVKITINLECEKLDAELLQLAIFNGINQYSKLEKTKLTVNEFIMTDLTPKKPK